MQLTPLCLMMSCLRVSPDRSQFFRYDTISLTCEDQVNSTGWKVKRRTLGGGIRRCSSGWGFAFSDSTCKIETAYPTDSGVYWCESADGEQSNSVNITIADGTVILDSPALPVSEGATVTLRCKAETTSSHPVFHFYKDGDYISSSSGGELTIHGASKSDEGLYRCSISGGAASTSSWLTVGASIAASNFTSAPPPSSCLTSVFRLMCYPVVGILYLLSTIVLGLVYRKRKDAAAARAVAERKGSSDVIVEITM